MDKIAVTIQTLESHNQEVHAIQKGKKLFKFAEISYTVDQKQYFTTLSIKDETYQTRLEFSENGRDIFSSFCDCEFGQMTNCLCRHLIASIFAIQGGIINAKFKLGMMKQLHKTVTANMTAKFIGSGEIKVLASPVMIALMEKAANLCLKEKMSENETSVGTFIEVKHIKPTAIGERITVTAEIDSILGDTIDFKITAEDDSGKIGFGKHTRVIVDTEEFLNKMTIHGGKKHDQ